MKRGELTCGVIGTQKKERRKMSKKIEKIQDDIYKQATKWVDLRDLANNGIRVLDEPQEIIAKLNEIIDRLNKEK